MVSKNIERIAGVVEAANARGIKINSQWLNYSNYYAVAVQPTAGELVEVTFDSDGWIHKLELVGEVVAPTVKRKSDWTIEKVEYDRTEIVQPFAKRDVLDKLVGEVVGSGELGNAQVAAQNAAGAEWVKSLQHEQRWRALKDCG